MFNFFNSDNAQHANLLTRVPLWGTNIMAFTSKGTGLHNGQLLGKSIKLCFTDPKIKDTWKSQGAPVCLSTQAVSWKQQGLQTANKQCIAKSLGVLQGC